MMQRMHMRYADTRLLVYTHALAPVHHYQCITCW